MTELTKFKPMEAQTTIQPTVHDHLHISLDTTYSVLLIQIMMTKLTPPY